MPHDTQEWKNGQSQDGRGIHVYIGKTELRRLEREGVLDMDEDIEYSVSVGSSDGRARAFVEMRNTDAE
jgi:hypothetical protein